MLAPHDQEPDPEPLRKAILMMPGGEWILPHYEEGPHHLVVIESITKDVNWAAADALRAYPGHLIAKAWDGFDEFRPMTVHAVPKFVYDLLCWHTSEDGLLLLDDGPSYDRTPTERDIAVDVLPNVLGHQDEEELASVLGEAEQAQGLPALLRLLGELDGAILSNPEDLITAVRGTLSAATATLSA